MKKDNFLNEGGINGLGEPLVNQNSSEFKALQEAIANRHRQLNEREIISHNVLSIKYQMESYVEQPEPYPRKTIGEFLEMLIESLGIPKSQFAAFVDFQLPNLSAILKNRRKVNLDLALKLGQIFHIQPELFLAVQNKNELLEVAEQNSSQYENYSLDHLLGKAG